VMVFKKRDHNVMKPRDTTILFVHNAGSIVSILLIGVYTYLRADIHCGFYITALVLALTTFAVPLLFRCWEYCVNFHLSLKKRKFQTQYFLDWDIASSAELSQFDKHYRQIRFLGSQAFLIKVLAFLIVVLTIPLTWLAFQPYFYLRADYGVCIIRDSIFIVALVVVGLFVTFALVIGALVYRSYTIYHGKFEIICITLLWCVHVIIYYYCAKYVAPSPNFDPSFILILGYFLTLFISCFFPLCYAYRFDKELAKTRESYEKFLHLLNSAEFRDEFYTFLTRQLCSENLQLYEVVSVWKTIPEDHPNRMAKANSIMTVFFSDDSASQVSVSPELKEELVNSLSTSLPVSSDVFDEVVTAVTHDMYEKSFAQFWVIWARKIY